MTTSNQRIALLVVATGALQSACFGDSSDAGNTPDASTPEDSSTQDGSSALDSGAAPEAAPGVDAARVTPGAASSPADGGSVGEGGPTAAPLDGGIGGPTAILVPALGSGFDYYQGSYALGWYFVANAAIQVTSLGFYDDMMNGLTESHPVAIYDKASQGQLVMATVSPSDPLTGYFRFTALPQPLTLSAGKEYVIIAWVGSENYLAYSSIDPGWTVAPAITYEGSAVNYANAMATTLLFPDTFTPGGGDFGPNFQFAAP